MFDDHVRNGKVKGPGRTVPGGYFVFRSDWARNSDCKYQFCEYDPETGATTIHGEHLSPDELAPFADPPVKAKPTPTKNDAAVPTKRPTPSPASAPVDEAALSGLLTDPAFAPIVKTLVVNQLSRNMEEHLPAQKGRPDSIKVQLFHPLFELEAPSSRGRVRHVHSDQKEEARQGVAEAQAVAAAQKHGWRRDWQACGWS